MARKQTPVKSSGGGGSNPVAKIFEKGVGLLGFHIIDPHYAVRAERKEKKMTAAPNFDDEIIQRVNVNTEFASVTDPSTEGELAELQTRIAGALADPGTVGTSVVAAFDKAEKLTGMKRDKLAYIGAGLGSVYLILGYFAELVCNFTGFAYPCYMSYKAVLTAEKEDDTHWLTYWTVFAVFSLIDFFSERIMSVFPFYWVLKCLFMAWLFLPMTRGADQVFARVVIPIMSKVDKLMGVKSH